MTTPEQQDRIKAYGVKCRGLFDNGATFHMSEARAFATALKWLDFELCDKLMKTLTTRAKP